MERAAVKDAVALVDSDAHVVADDDKLVLRCALELLVADALRLTDAAFVVEAVTDAAALTLALA